MDTLFGNASTNTKQGDIGEARAIYEYTRLGYGVSRTLFDSMKYDLIIDDGFSLKRVQVKTTRYRVKSGYYEATLKTSGGNRYSNKISPRQDGDYDVLFVLAENGCCWSIPVSQIQGKNSITLGKIYEKFIL